MSWLTSLRPSRQFIRRTGLALATCVVMCGIAVAVNIAGIQIIGSVGGWEQWLRAHSRYFLVWRLFLYVATACGWWWMRRRLLQRESNAHQRLLRTEVSSVIAIILLEASQLLLNG